jgi:hypothetical protein
MQVQLAHYKKDQTFLSKWAGTAQRSWRFGSKADGHLFVDLSYDGTATAHTMLSSVIPLFDDNRIYRLAFSYNVALDLNSPPTAQAYFDEVRFWLQDADGNWNLIGAPVQATNVGNVALFNSTSRVSVGADSDGAAGNTQGLFRYVSVRNNVGPNNTLGGIEVGLMRGDLTTNPTYDRYGNLWNNVGGWSYAQMSSLQ